jgi:predicted AAA+ superfamily ATPase
MQGFPVVAITGPRQAGKTTLARSLAADRPHLSLENPDTREFALTDPRGFLAQFPHGAVLDEVQRAPAFLSWLQQRVDERAVMGEFILTGSAQFDLMAGLAQSLAGRVGRLELLPFAGAELGAALPATLEAALLKGAYPPLYDRPVDAADWFPNYVATYLERDVRQLVGVRDLVQFQRFVRLCAARSGQMLNLAALGNDAGVSAVTARQWLSVLEASYLVARLPPYHVNFGKRLVKTPKLYFLDAGLLAWLLGIRDAASLASHAARGALFETWVVSEVIKWRFNAGRPAELYFWRDNVGHEIDLLLETPEGVQAIEIKSGATFASDWPAAALRWRQWADAAGVPTRTPMVVHVGKGQAARQGIWAVGWREFAQAFGNHP